MALFELLSGAVPGTVTGMVGAKLGDSVVSRVRGLVISKDEVVADVRAGIGALGSVAVRVASVVFLMVEGAVWEMGRMVMLIRALVLIPVWMRVETDFIN